MQGNLPSPCKNCSHSMTPAQHTNVHPLSVLFYVVLLCLVEKGIWPVFEKRGSVKCKCLEQSYKSFFSFLKSPVTEFPLIQFSDMFLFACSFVLFVCF